MLMIQRSQAITGANALIAYCKRESLVSGYMAGDGAVFCSQNGSHAYTDKEEVTAEMTNHMGERIDRQFSQMLDLPAEIALDLPRVNLIGNIEVRIDNHKGIRQYEEERIIVNCREGVLVVEGKELTLKSISQDELCIAGAIEGVRFADKIR